MAAGRYQLTRIFGVTGIWKEVPEELIAFSIKRKESLLKPADPHLRFVILLRKRDDIEQGIVEFLPGTLHLAIASPSMSAWQTRARGALMCRLTRVRFLLMIHANLTFDS
jgi:hypothetical protein